MTFRKLFPYFDPNIEVFDNSDLYRDDPDVIGVIEFEFRCSFGPYRYCHVSMSLIEKQVCATFYQPLHGVEVVDEMHFDDMDENYDKTCKFYCELLNIPRHGIIPFKSNKRKSSDPSIDQPCVKRTKSI
jgi:hypothetical protein